MQAGSAGEVALILFCRRPRLGSGKGRLAAEIGPGAAAELAAQLLSTALEDAAEWPGPVVISPADPADTGWAHGLLKRKVSVIAQPGGNLGERLNSVDTAARATGLNRLLYIGSDAPGLDGKYFALARAALTAFDVAIGPAADGGVTAMGSRVAWPRLADLDWGTARLQTGLEACCRDAGLSVKMLEIRRDVDVATDLAAIRSDCRHDERPGRRALLAWLDAFAPADRGPSPLGR